MKNNEVNYQEIRASVIKKIERCEVRMHAVTMPDFFLTIRSRKRGTSHLAKRISSVVTKRWSHHDFQLGVNVLGYFLYPNDYDRTDSVEPISRSE
jgi:hypothetical protein